MIKKIIICGFNEVALIAAFVLKQQLKNIDVVLLQSEVPSPPAVAESADRFFYRFLEVLGINLKTFMQRTDALPRLGTKLSGWNKAADFFVSATPCGEKINGDEFYQLFSKCKSSGLDLNYSDYSLTEKLCKYNQLPADFSANAVIRSGINYDANKFSMYLYGLIRSIGVGVINELIKTVDVNDEKMIASIKTEKNTYTADFFLDCTSNLLLMKEYNLPYVDLSENIKINKSCFTVRPHGQNNNASFLTAQDNVVIRKVPLRSVAITEVLYSSHITSDIEAKKILERHVGGEVANVIYRQSSPGYKNELWKKNCLCLGQSAVDLGNIHYSYFHIAQSMLMRFVDYFPSLDSLDQISREYNRLTINEISRIYDYHLLFLWGLPEEHALSLRNKNTGSLTFERKIKLFIETGRILSFDFEVAEPNLWADFFISLGIIPKNISPLVDSMSSGRADLENLQYKLDALVKKMPQSNDVLSSFLDS